MASNTTLLEYFSRYGEFAASPSTFTPEDVYLSGRIGLWESLNAGVTSIVDHASHTWSVEHSLAGLNSSIDSGARVWWCYSLHNLTFFSLEQQMDQYRAISKAASYEGTPTSLGITYDFWVSNPPETNEVFMQLVR